jgi:hypothetical protein
MDSAMATRWIAAGTYRLPPVLGGSGAKLSRPLAVSPTSAPPTFKASASFDWTIGGRSGLFPSLYQLRNGGSNRMTKI